MKIKLLSVIILYFLSVTVGNCADYEFFSTKQKSVANRIINEAKSGDYDEAVSIANHSGDLLLVAVAKWMKYRVNNDGDSFEDIAHFVKEHSNWPDLDSIRLRAEEKLSFTSDPAVISGFFAEYPPISGKAKLFYAAVKNSANSDPEVKTLIKEGWVAADITVEEYNFFKNKFGNIINSDLNIKRVDRMLMQGKVSLAKREMHLIDKPYHDIFDARIKMFENKHGVEKVLARIPEKLKNDPGIIYSRILWRKERNMDEGVRELLLKLPDNYEYAAKFWDIRNYQARELLAERKYKQAYEILKNHGNKEGGADYADAEWFMGWIALRFLNNPSKAYEHFDRLYKNVNYPISKARAAYWAGRALEAASKKDEAAGWFKEAAQYFTTFYGQLAGERVSGALNLQIPSRPVVSENDKSRFKQNDLAKIAVLFAEYSERDGNCCNGFARKFITKAIENESSAGGKLLVADYAKERSIPLLSIEAAKHSERDLVYLLEEGYPMLRDLPSNIPIEKSLMYGIIRQESRFDQKAVSPAGALGLMQLMPATAKVTAKNAGIDFDKSMLTDPKYNVALGTNFLGKLLGDYSDFYILAIASYNAGPSNVNKWIALNGDPRAMKNGDEIIDWIELIPFQETRNYVQRVLENTNMYNNILTNKEASKNMAKK